MTSGAAILCVDEAPGVVASVERIDAWMAVARPSDRFAYATRASLPPAAQGAKRMRDLAQRGLVHLFQARSAQFPDLHNYIAMRSAVPSAMTRPERPVLALPPVPIADGEVSAIDALLPVLERFARAGRPCPTNRQLAERAGLAEAAIAPAMRAMADARLIKVIGVAAPTTRRVLILSNGAFTGLVA